ncbi:hybrid sensor histidine kinase/response regulator [Virgibacillus dokdonensis]|uniref:hybrid sensor histidine kinase/response regulator n=1 Tax=Virgibacillus dokdonensis TaxID=302167 RepID=UPI00098AE0BB|nr:ATP-binding protein [Virgibacillus dokdonensis]
MSNKLTRFLRRKKYFLSITILFLILLSGSRFLWTNIFQSQEQLSIKNGQLDLRDWDATSDDILLLDGNWEFYPQALITGNEPSQLTKTPKTIQVPGEWNEALQSPYGFGTYRLQVQVDPNQDINYSMRVSSIRSASKIFVNGRLIDESGQVGKEKETYLSKNLPYSATFTADENGKVDIWVQAANFTDKRSSGIVRSMKFGSEDAILTDIKFSYTMQIASAIVFLVHVVYALLLYFLGNREKRLLFFSILVFSAMMGSLLSSDEKLFHQFIYMGQEWDFRLANTLLLLTFYALINCTEHRTLPYWQRIYPIYAIMLLGTAGITLFLNVTQIISLFPVYLLFIGIATIISVIAIWRQFTSDPKVNVLLLFSLTALTHHFIWTIIWRESGVTVPHYPFDLFIAMGCFASVWFKDYFKMYADTKKLASRLQRMNEHKDQFLANTSHEFKNPLHGILNMSQAILEREQFSLQQRSVKELETILSVGRRMDFILNDLLDVTSLKQGSYRLKKEPISIASIIAGVNDMLRFTIEGKPIKIVQQIPLNFPKVLADENRVIQIVFNLLHNAVKYTNEGQITIHAYVEGEKAIISITDTGIGMDKEMLTRLFQPYEQANAKETRIEGGFGLGLSITKQLVELHGGTLEVDSTLGKGSTFTFSLELANAQEVDSFYQETQTFLDQTTYFHTESSALQTETASTTEAKRKNNPTARQANILIVDDDPVNLEVMKTILHQENYRITTVMNGQQALAILNEKEWDLIISDVMMPQMSGYELTERIRKQYSLTELPILLLTARRETDDIRSGFLAGANDYVTKPVEAMEIRSRIETLTSIKQAAQEQLRLETAWLQAQIQPHFLFNTLNAIASLSIIDVEKMQDLLNEFSHFLRNKFKFKNMNELIPLEEELKMVRSYLYIEQVRFSDRLQVDWDIDTHEEIKVPFLTIQPLIENAIRHGIMNRVQGGTIWIRVKNYATYVEISIEDNGVGIDEAKLAHILSKQSASKSGVGLVNTDLRLKRFFGEGLSIASILGESTIVSFQIKKEQTENQTIYD